MKTYVIPIINGLATVALLGLASMAWAQNIEPNKKRGQVYYRMVCTACHVDMSGKAIPPNGRKMAEWRAYLDADRHDSSGKTNSSVRFYISQEFRKSIKDKNKAAEKFLTLPDAQLYTDVREFMISGGKDSDTPATCL